MKNLASVCRALGAFLAFAAAASLHAQTSPDNPAGPASSPPSSGAVAPATNPPPASSDSVVQMSPFDVSSAGDHGWSTANSVGATLLNTPILNTPISIDVLNQQFIQDVAALDPVQAASWVASVTVASDSPGVGQITVRGQNIDPDVRDGIFDPIEVTGASFYDTSLIDRVEIIEGPEGTIYGDVSGPGGLMNVVTKEPQPIAATTVQTFLGADEFGGMVYRGMLDSTGPVPGVDGLDYRLILTGQQGTTVAGQIDNTFVFSPMLTYHFKGGGSVLFRYSYQNPSRALQGSWFVDDANQFSTLISPDVAQGMPDEKDEQFIHALDLEFNQPFTTGPIDWNARVYARYDHFEDSRLFYNNQSPYIDFLNAQGQVIGNESNMALTNPGIAAYEVPLENRALEQTRVRSGSLNVDLVGNFDLGPSKNTLLMYAEDVDYVENQQEVSGNFPGIVLWSDVPTLAPYYWPNPVAEWGPQSYVTNQEILNDTTSAGAQENMSFLKDHVILVAAIRTDHQTETIYNYISNQPLQENRQGNTHRLGAVIKPIEPLTLFYNFSETFTPEGVGTTAAGTSYALPNIVSNMSEYGAKLGLFNNRLSVTASYFRTVESNEIIPLTGISPSGEQVTVNTPAGRAVIRGWEMNGTWAVNRNLNLLFGAGNLTSKTQTGLDARNVPFGTDYRLLAKYSFYDGWLGGTFLGAGVQHNGPRAGDAADDFNLPAYTMYNAFAGYQWGPHWRFQVNVQNLTNDIFAQFGVIRYFIDPSNPRNANGTITYSF